MIPNFSSEELISSSTAGPKGLIASTKTTGPRSLFGCHCCHAVADAAGTIGARQPGFHQPRGGCGWLVGRIVGRTTTARTRVWLCLVLDHTASQGRSCRARNSFLDRGIWLRRRCSNLVQASHIEQEGCRTTVTIDNGHLIVVVVVIGLAICYQFLSDQLVHGVLNLFWLGKSRVGCPDHNVLPTHVCDGQVCLLNRIQDVLSDGSGTVAILGRAWILLLLLLLLVH